MSSIFSKIINGSIPSYKIDETDQFYVFLDINPLQKGHTLIIPKLEVDYIFDLPEYILNDYLIYAQKIATAIKRAILCNRVGISVFGLEVAHAHMHLIPISNIGDMNFSNRSLEFSSEEMQKIANEIIAEL